jgi:ABC-type Fe3+/spermidine/putrescine transport system ATPase subunit
MGATNFLEGRVTGHGEDRTIEAGGLSFPVPMQSKLRSGQTVSFAVRPERIQLTLDGPQPPSAVRGHIRRENYHGDTSSYVIELESEQMLVVRDRNNEATGVMHRFPVGTAVWARWNPEAVQLLDS